MQTQGGSYAEDAITGSSRTMSQRVLVDWKRDGKFNHPFSNITEFISSVEVDRDLTGIAPTEVLLVEGSSNAQLSITLSGTYEGEQLTTLFSPYSGSATFSGVAQVGAEIRWEIVVETTQGPVVYPQFIGNIRTIGPDRGANEVVITALDRVEQLRKNITLPVWAAGAEYDAYGESDSQFARSSWLIESVLRQCDVGAGAKRPRYREEIGLLHDAAEGCQLWVTGNGSYVPTVGWLDNLASSSFPKSITMFSKTGPRHPDSGSDAPKTFGLNGVSTPLTHYYGSAQGQGLLRYWSADRFRLQLHGSHYLGFTLNTNGTNGDRYKTTSIHQAMEVGIGSKCYLYIEIQPNQVRTKFVNKNNNTESASAWVNIPQGVDNVDVMAVWDMTVQTGRRAYLKVNPTGNPSGGSVYNWNTFSSQPALPVVFDELAGRVTIGHALSMSDIFYVSRFVSNTSNATSNAYAVPKYRAQLDEGLNRLSYLPTARNAEAWSIVTEVAGAEFGTVFWDERGVFRFWNFNTMVTKQDQIVRRLTLDQVTGLKITNSLDSIRNSYSVTTTKKRGVGIINAYDSNDVNEFLTPGKGTKYFPLYSEKIIAPWPAKIEKYDTHDPGDPGNDDPNRWPTWNADVVHGYCVQWNYPNLGWYEAPSRGTVDVTVFFAADGRLQVRVYNPFDEECRFASGGSGISANWPGATSSPAFRFAGTIVEERDNIVITKAHAPSIAKYGFRTLSLSGDYYQDTLLESGLVERLITRTIEPIPNTEEITIAGDPRLQLGDSMIIEDPDGFGEAMRVQIFGIRRVMDASGLTDTLTVEMLRPGNAALSTRPPIEVPDLAPEPFPEAPDDGGVYRTNLCPNPALGADTDGWYGPVGSDRVTKAEDLPRRTAWQTKKPGQIKTPVGKVRAGYKYSASIFATAPDKDVELSFYVAWFTDAGFISNSEISKYSIKKETTQELTSGIITAPANATRMTTVVFGLPEGSEEDGNPTVLFTGCLYEQTISKQAYFDGDTPGAVWLGTEDRSVSRIRVSADPEPGGPPPNPEPQPENGTDTAAYTQGWGSALPLSDTFSYTGSVNPNKWTLYGAGGNFGGQECWTNADGGRFCTQQVSVGGGFLRINGSSGGDSGGIVSQFSQRYGRWEVRMKLGPFTAGTSQYKPVAKLFPTNEIVPQGGQYEFFRATMGDTTAKANLYKPADTVIVSAGTSDTLDLTQWHNYGFDWSDTALVCYIDGVEFYRVTDGSYQSPGNMSLRIAVDSMFGTAMAAAYLDVAWARIYSPVLSSTTGYGVGGYGTQPYGQ